MCKELSLGTIVDKEVFASLDAGSKTVKQMNEQMNIEKFEDLKDAIEEQLADNEERADFFRQAAGADQDDDLLDELNELEAEMAEDEMDIEIGAGSIAQSDKINQQKQPVIGAGGKQKAPAQQDDEDLLAQMMA